MARTKRTPAGWLKVGDRVVSNTPGIDWRGVVVEDRGPLAINGSQIVAIRLDYAPDAPQFEVRAEELERAWDSLMWEPKRPHRPSKSRGAHRCKECGGSGRVPGITKTRGIGMGSELGPCPACDGTGWLSDESDDAQTLHNVRELTPEEFEQHFGELPTDGEG